MAHEKNDIDDTRDIKNKEEEKEVDESNLEDVIDEEVDALQEEISNLTTQVATLQDSLLREQAEVQNFKKRLRQETEQTLKYANQMLLVDLIRVLDGFEEAQKKVPENPELQSFLEGFQMIHKQLLESLEHFGLETIATDNTLFDPMLHQAIAQAHDEALEDQAIIEVFQKGYKLYDRVLRPSMVKINNKGAKE